jgi:hypothetical protein
MIVIPGTRIVAFVGSDGADGRQLWTSDGTLAGTARFGRMGSLAGSGASIARNLGVAGDRLFFTGGIEGASGEELWALQLGTQGAAFARTYGDGRCPGTGQLEPRIGAFGLPRLGNTAFAIDLLDARPATAALVQLGMAQSDVPIGRCRLVALPYLASLPPVATNPQGMGRTPLPIPNNQGLIGLRLTAQYFVLDPNGALMGVLALSDGLLMQLGQ